MFVALLLPALLQCGVAPNQTISTNYSINVNDCTVVSSLSVQVTGDMSQPIFGTTTASGLYFFNITIDSFNSSSYYVLLSALTYLTVNINTFLVKQIRLTAGTTASDGALFKTTTIQMTYFQVDVVLVNANAVNSLVSAENGLYVTKSFIQLDFKTANTQLSLFSAKNQYYIYDLHIQLMTNKPADPSKLMFYQTAYNTFVKNLLINVTSLSDVTLCDSSFQTCTYVTNNISQVNTSQPHLFAFRNQTVVLRGNNFVLNQYLSSCLPATVTSNYCTDPVTCSCASGNDNNLCCCCNSDEILLGETCLKLATDRFGNVCGSGDRLSACRTCGAQFGLSENGRCLLKCDSTCYAANLNSTGDCVCDCRDFVAVDDWGCNIEACSDSSKILVGGSCRYLCQNCAQGLGFYADGQLVFLNCSSGYRMYQGLCVPNMTADYLVYIICGCIAAIGLVITVILLSLVAAQITRYKRLSEDD